LTREDLYDIIDIMDINDTLEANKYYPLNKGTGDCASLILDVETTISNKGNPFDETNKLCYVGLLDTRSQSI
jgi:hypothetical protein